MHLDRYGLIFMAHSHLEEDPALRDRVRVFRNRKAAGERLAGMLSRFCGSGALVAAIPAGGVPVAVEIASGLALELEVLPVSKVLLPWNTESGFGAVAFDGSVWIDHAAVARLGLSDEAVAQSTAEAKAKVERRTARLRGARAGPELAGRDVILVDDGIAAGSTMRTAIAALKRQKVRSVTVAVPTGHARSVDRIATLADGLCCANIRGSLSFAVADAYEHWHDVTDAELARILARTN